MNTLKLYKRAEWYLEWLKTNHSNAYETEKDKIYTCLGEFSHAPGHYLMCVFGTWELSGMHELDNFEEIDHHPDDFVAYIALDDIE